MIQRFLVVDDSLVSRMMVKTIILNVVPDAEIIEANCGEDALQKVKNTTEIDFAFIDFNMPGMDGLQLFKALSDHLTIPKRALLTANIQINIKNRAEEQSVTFINKPLDETSIQTFILN